MTIKAILDKARLQDETTGGDDKGSGGGDPANTEKGDQGGKDNKEDNLISHENLWDASIDDDKSGDKPGDKDTGQQTQPDPNEVFNKHIEGLDFSTNIDLAAGMTAIQQGDTEVFGKLIQQIGANAYRNALVDANKVVQQRVDKMADSVKSEVSTSNATSDLVKEMNAELPFTKSPAFAPIAQLTLTQFIEKGVPPKKAIAEVGKYFSTLSGEIGKLSPNAPDGRPAGHFGNRTRDNQAGDSDEDGPDWIELLGGPVVQ